VTTLRLAHHEKLLARAFTCDYSVPLQEVATPTQLQAWLSREQPGPIQSSDEVRAAVRSLLRWGGFKPSGRSKPASEYLDKAESLASINAAVDAGNVVSLHSGLPISVIDLDLALPPYRLEIVTEKIGYVFNPSGQELDLKGLLCLWDSQGPCASPVKDSQRSKTHGQTRRTLCLIWGSQEVAAQVESALKFYHQVLSHQPEVSNLSPVAFEN
jgi:DNA/RNA-binding domain of Phe-tRNA-synthetase-like protein